MKPNNGLIFQVLRSSGQLTTNQKMVLLILLNHWNPSASGSLVWPGQQRLTEQSSLSERSVRRALAELADSGLIKITREVGRSNRYQLNIEQISALDDQTPATGAGVPVDNLADTGQSGRSHRPERPVTPARVADECLSECLTNPLRHSEPIGPARTMPHLGVVAGSAVNALRKKKA